MYSMRYGTVPIVRATGGLDDTVENFDASTGAGNWFQVRTVILPGACLKKYAKRFTFMVRPDSLGKDSTERNDRGQFVVSRRAEVPGVFMSEVARALTHEALHDSTV